MRDDYYAELARQNDPDDSYCLLRRITLKWKLRHAVTVANSFARVLENERAETGEKIRKLDWALLLERSAHQRLKENPLGHQLGPTPAEVQERLAKERERAAQWEYKRQEEIEQGLWRNWLRRSKGRGKRSDEPKRQWQSRRKEPDP